ncbi:hypothetical protein Tcan_10135 [Toxocara canis]|uniref:Uncharacterized protein n=1 Tax=Toxocara canis TaxID=6265 RepID=A0A0B2VAL0_TOXCA|nr:hypothetical protein Tcan_10135 [Toxocara canis]
MGRPMYALAISAARPMGIIISKKLMKAFFDPYFYDVCDPAVAKYLQTCQLQPSHACKVPAKLADYDGLARQSAEIKHPGGANGPIGQLRSSRFEKLAAVPTCPMRPSSDNRHGG